MQKIRHVCRQIITPVVVFMMIGMTPAPLAFADTPTDGSGGTSTVTPTSMPTVPANGPTGPDAALYTYNGTTGQWESAYYIYDPTTKITTPKTPLEYTYNALTTKWDTLMWQFDATSNQYKQVTLSVDTPPDGAITHGGPATPQDGTVDTLAATPDDSLQSDTTDGPTGDTPTDGTGGSTVGNTTTAGMDNTINSSSQSGDASANKNNNVGTVASGGATTTTDVINQLQSQSSLTNGNVATFTANIQGNVTGDMVIDPANLTQNTAADPQNLNGAKITNTTNGTINNNITLTAATGNATANDNNNVKSVTTGDANAIADVINMINSVVAANQSFIGTINIYGDYTGNILMPADSLNALLSSAGTVGSDGSVSNSAQYAVVNNVDLNAASGDASASNNNNVKNMTTGNALTNVTILNLTGHQVVAANCLLVFVNVMGTWVGLILDAPAGTTAAALGGGVTTSNTALPSGTQVTNNENFGITNNITASATTGNATANNNNNVGTVATGDASASANIANIIGSNFSLSNWFGILFINVFGTWHGNFGLVKPPVVAPITPGSPVPPAGGSTPAGSVKAFEFVPKSTSTSGSNDTDSKYQLAPFSSTSGGGSNGGDIVQQTSAVLGTAIKNPASSRGNDIKQTLNQGINYWTILLFALGAAGFGVVGIERVRTNIRIKTTAGKK